MEKILVSACLLGHKVRYNGTDAAGTNDLLERWRSEGRLVPFCPEVAGGFPVPRPPAEISGGEGGDVLDGESRVIEEGGKDVSEYFQAGAELTLREVRRQNIRVAVLKEDSPSCGSSRIYDGSFSGRSRPGQGVTTALLEDHGVRVFSEEQTAAADAHLRRLEAG